MSSLKPLKLYSHRGPNPPKVAIILEELSLPYEQEYVPDDAIKKEPFTKINPNGRLPALEDPNTGVSAAIIEYVVDEYDKDAKPYYTTFPEKYTRKSWVYFQMSGQGPYFGQAGWFLIYHPEKLPSALERYQNEIRRVLGVINSHLKDKGTPYLIGDKCTYADLMFVPWNHTAQRIMEKEDFDMEKDFPVMSEWHKRLMERESVKTVHAAIEKSRAEANNK